jgi:hypothetical protein
MFPGGAAGTGLLLLRCSVTAALLSDGTAHWNLALIWLIIGLLLSVGLLTGFQTPYCSSASCLFELYTFCFVQHEIHLALAILDGVALALLGPGAYSVDARIFGRRLLIVPSRRNPDAP